MLVQTYQSGETNKRSEVHKDTNTGDYSVKHYHKGAMIKHVPITGNQDPHHIAKRYVTEKFSPEISDHHYDAATSHVKQAEHHYNKAGETHASDLHWHASGEHLLAAELHKSGDHENSSKAAKKAHRLSAAAWNASKLHEDRKEWPCPYCEKKQHKGECAEAKTAHARHITKGSLKEDGAPTNNAGSGAIAGLGVGVNGQPGVNLGKSRVMKILRRKKK